jgi:protein-tyrosine phosphatase
MDPIFGGHCLTRQSIGAPTPLRLPPVTTSVLYVCTGNVCRSPFAELLGRHLFPSPSLSLASAGIGALVGQGVDEHLAYQLSMRGASSEGFAARMLTPPLVAEADIVLTMTRRQRDRVVSESPDSVWRVFVVGQFTRIVSEVEPGLSGDPLAVALREAHRPPEKADEVADPRRRGAAAAAAAASELDAHVRAALPRLLVPTS